MIIVPDASVILKWVLPENISPLQKQALAVRNTVVTDEYKLLVPALWRYEVGNTLTRIVPEESLRLIQLCESVGLEEVSPTAGWLQLVVELVQTYQVSFYDASYHALAINQSGVFVTADEKYIKKVGESQNIKSLKDF